jgi:Rieske 2Fe-2S family protein
MARSATARRVSQLLPLGPRKPLVRVERGLPAAWYRDGARYQRELEAIWNRNWIAVARADEVARPDGYRVVRIGEQSIVLLRREDDSLAAFHNTCRHRGSILLTDEAGRLPSRRLSCPYHAWTYDLAGRLVDTPRRMPTRDFDPARLGLHPVALECWGGFAFVNLAPENAPPLAEALGELPVLLRNYELGRLVVGRRIEREVRANWKLLVENFSECLHCPPVHPELCRIVTAYREGGAWGLRKNERTPEYKPGAKTLTLDGTARIAALPKLSPEERERLYRALVLAPGLFLNLHPDYVHTHRMLPSGPERVRIVYEWLFAPEALPQGADLEHYVALWDLTNAQDARNCEWQQQGMRSAAFRHGIFMPQEFDCHRFTAWLRGQMSRPRGPAKSRKAGH